MAKKATKVSNKKAVEAEAPAKPSKSKAKVKDKVAAKKAKVTGKVKKEGVAKAAPSSTATALSNIYRTALVKVDKEAGVSSGTGTQVAPIHTGSLTQDFICGGGARPGLFVAQGMEASGKCLVGSTLLSTDRGFLTLRELGGANGFHRVASPFSVATHKGTRPVSHTFKGTAKTIRVTTRNGFTAEGTDVHKMLVITSELRLVWRKLRAIRVGDWIVAASLKQDVPFGTNPKVSLAMSTILGHLTANGQQARLSTGDANVAARFTQAVIDETGSAPTVHIDDSRVNTYSILGGGAGRHGSSFARAVLAPLGYTAEVSAEKCIPHAVRSAPREVLHEFLEAYFECDCGVDGNNISLMSASKTLIEQLHVILLQGYGIVAKRSSKWASAANSSSPTERKYYKLTLGGSDCIKFLQTFHRAKAHAYSDRFYAKTLSQEGKNKQVPFVRAAVEAAYDKAKVSDIPMDSRVYAMDGTVLGNFKAPPFTRQSLAGKRGNLHATRRLWNDTDWSEFLPMLAMVDSQLANRLQLLSSADYHYEEVVEVKAGKKNKEVYDITVPSVHAFVAGGLVAHNSTSCVHMTEQAARYNIPLRTYLDPEGAVGPDFVQHVITSSDPSSLFGEAVGYYQDNIIEDVCTHVAGIVDLFPEKDYIDELKSWVYKVPRGKDPANVAMLDRLKQVGLKPDEKFSKGLDSFIIPTDYAGPEFFIALDSWASLVPRKAKENAKTKDLTGGDALAARVFGQYVPLFGGELKKRGGIMWTVNQLRTNPRQMFGDPLYAKSDGTLKFYYTCTNRMMPRAVPQGLPKDKETGALGMEPSVYGGGVDRYSYKGVSNLKNKWGRPFLKGMLRIWVSDHEGHMRGIDPVWDTMEYLRMTGQQDGGNKKLKFMPRPSAPAGLKALAGKGVEYMDFKRLIIAEHVGDKEMLSSVMKKLKLTAPPKIREGLIAQMRKDTTLWAGGGRVEAEQQDGQDDNADE